MSATIEEIQQTALNMRKNVLKMALNAGANSSHLGGGLSFIDIVACLYKKILNIDPIHYDSPTRDRFILSKGHGVLGLYAALYEKGFLSYDELMTFGQADSYLLGHPVMNISKGIEATTGSLGMGLSLAIGKALHAKRQNLLYHTYVLLGDGECNEGSVWEAVMSASHFKLDNLTVIVDKNNLQQTGTTNDILSNNNLCNKWQAFGWNAIETDGHNIASLIEIFESKNSHEKKPTAIIANTIKGKGITFMENNNDWHHKILSQEQFDKAMNELNNQKV